MTTGRDFGRNRGGIREAHPEDAPREVPAVAMDEFRSELRLSDPAEPGRCGDLYLTDRGSPARLELAGQRLQILLAPHEKRIGRKQHARANRQGPGRGDLVVDRKCRESGLGVLRIGGRTHRARKKMRARKTNALRVNPAGRESFKNRLASRRLDEADEVDMDDGRP